MNGKKIAEEIEELQREEEELWFKAEVNKALIQKVQLENIALDKQSDEIRKRIAELQYVRDALKIDTRTTPHVCPKCLTPWSCNVPLETNIICSYPILYECGDCQKKRFENIHNATRMRK